MNVTVLFMCFFYRYGISIKVNAWGECWPREVWRDAAGMHGKSGGRHVVSHPRDRSERLWVPLQMAFGAVWFFYNQKQKRTNLRKAIQVIAA